MPRKHKGQYYRLARFDYLGDLFLFISVVSEQGDVIQEAACLGEAALLRPSHLWWGKSWTLDRPLETLPPNCKALIVLRSLTFSTGLFLHLLFWEAGY